jgi:catechol 2,3-dioxygenase-like lactoylglutathione lyase family enzyme
MRKRKEGGMLESARVAARLPAQDLQRARAFYAEKLGLEPAEGRPGGLLYRLADGEFSLFESGGSPSGEHSQMAFEVEDIRVAVKELRWRGVIFEEYDAPGLATGGQHRGHRGELPEQGKQGARGLVS